MNAFVYGARRIFYVILMTEVVGKAALHRAKWRRLPWTYAHTLQNMVNSSLYQDQPSDGPFRWSQFE